MCNDIEELWSEVFHEIIELDDWNELFLRNSINENINKIKLISKLLDISYNENISIKSFNFIETSELINKIENKYHIKYDLIEDDNYYKWNCCFKNIKHVVILAKDNNLLYAKDDDIDDAYSFLIQSEDDLYGIVDSSLLGCFRNKELNNISIILDLSIVKGIIDKIENEFNLSFIKEDNNNFFIWKIYKDNYYYNLIYDKYNSLCYLEFSGKGFRIFNNEKPFIQKEYLENYIEIEASFRVWYCSDFYFK